MSTALSLARKIESATWSWDAAQWKQGLPGLGLRADHSRGDDRLEFTDPAGAHWTVYLDGPRVENVEITFDLYLETAELAEDEFDRIADEYLAKFEVQSAELVDAFGSSQAIDDDEQEESYPEAGECLYLALWRLRDKLLMLALKSEDREVPIRLCLIMIPPSELP